MRALPVKKRTVELDGDYEGWSVTFRINPPSRLFSEFASGEFDRVLAGLGEIILDWNFVDEEGNPLGPPSLETMKELPIDLVNILAERFAQEAARVPPSSPKA